MVCKHVEMSAFKQMLAFKQMSKMPNSQVNCKQFSVSDGFNFLEKNASGAAMNFLCVAVIQHQQLCLKHQS